MTTELRKQEYLNFWNLLALHCRIAFALVLTSSFSHLAHADFFEWSNTEIQYLHGDSYRNPSNPRDITQSILTFSHADGWKYGRNFLFLDALITEDGQPSQTNLYGEMYSYLSLSKVIDKNLSFSIFKDLNASIAVNAGENLDSPKSGSRVALYGFTIDFNLPFFKVFNIDFMRHNVLEPVAIGTSWQMTTVWKMPFEIANTKWSLEGFADFTESKNAKYVGNILAQPQLRLDIGDLWGQSNHVYVGIEYQYWHNKYGIRGLNEGTPQALVLWKF